MEDNRMVAGAKRVWVLGLVGAALLLAGSIFGVDWMNYFYETDSLYPAVGKPVITLIGLILVLMIGNNRLNRTDWGLLLGAFLCMLPTDVLMSVVVVSPALTVGSWVFMIGGVLSIFAHIFLIIRLVRVMPSPRAFRPADLWLPALIYGGAAVVMAVLWPDIVRVGHAVIGPIYTAFFCTTMWLAWETVRRRTLPRADAWMAAIAATCWFATEITGEIFNLGLGTISEIMFRLVWVFYGTNVVLWALSGYRWTGAEGD
jgi:hypothetical protein